jgi:ferredoxin-type protein NapG
MPDLSRRQWLRRLAPAAIDAIARGVERGIERSLPPRRRPPGSVSEALFQLLCTRCGECAKACPHAAIHTFTSEAGVDAGTPVMRPDRRPCHMCEDFPCAAACREGALEIPETPTWPLGRVRIESERCIAFAGPECGACAGLCPPGVLALRIERWRPELDAEGCVGCGRCIESCPTTPRAIELLPLEAVR